MSDGQPNSAELQFLTIPLEDGFFIAQGSDPGGKSYLALLRVSVKYLVLYELKDEAIASLAIKVGLTNLSGSTIPHGADKKQVKTLFVEMAALISKRHSNDDITAVYSRHGGFADPAKPDQRAAADKAYAERDSAAGVPLFRALADRGDPLALYRLAQAYALRGNMRFTATEVAKQAYASGQYEAALLLGYLYRAGDSGTLYPKEAPINPDYELALEWAAAARAHGVRVREADEALQAWAVEACQRPSLKAKHPDLQECTTVLIQYFDEKAKNVHKIESLDAALVEIYLERKVEENKLSAIQAERAKLHAEKLQLEAQKSLLDDKIAALQHKIMERQMQRIDSERNSMDRELTQLKARRREICTQDPTLPNCAEHL